MNRFAPNGLHEQCQRLDTPKETSGDVFYIQSNWTNPKKSEDLQNLHVPAKHEGESSSALGQALLGLATVHAESFWVMVKYGDGDVEQV